MRLRVESDGTVHGTRLLTEAGEPIAGVQSIAWRCAMRDPIALVTVELKRVPIVASGEAREQCAECGGPVARGEGWRLACGGLIHDVCPPEEME